MLDSGGLKPETLKKRKTVLDAFAKYIGENYDIGPIRLLLERDRPLIEQAFIEFFSILTVRKRIADGSMTEMIPKKATFEFWKSIKWYNG